MLPYYSEFNIYNKHYAGIMNDEAAHVCIRDMTNRWIERRIGAFV